MGDMLQYEDGLETWSKAALIFLNFATIVFHNLPKLSWRDQMARERTVRLEIMLEDNEVDIIDSWGFMNDLKHAG